MPYKKILGDIRFICADAVVIPANPKPVVGRGVDGLIYDEAGKDSILSERRKIGEMACGDVAVTYAGSLNAKILIHAVSPYWNGGDKGEDYLLESCYEKAMTAAVENDCSSIVFPLLSTGNMRYPKERAEEIAEKTIKRILKQHDLDVILVIYDGGRKSKNAKKQLQEYNLDNDYSKLDVADYKNAKRYYDQNPEALEGRDVYERMEKQYARMLADQNALRRYNAWVKKQKSNYSFGGSIEPINHMRFMMPSDFRQGFGEEKNKTLAGLLKELREGFEEEKNKTFAGLLIVFRDKKGIVNNAVLAGMAMLNQYTVTRLTTGEIAHQKAVDKIWCLGKAMDLDKEEVTMLLMAYGISPWGGRNTKERDRCAAIESCYVDAKTVEDLNKALKENYHQRIVSDYAKRKRSNENVRS